MESLDEGYKDERFESEVDENFHCPICLNVLKEPRMCRRNQHYFCTPCITRHLQNSSMCPSCREELSVETLTEAPRIVDNYLSNLKIHCDNYERGCTEVVQLENLKRHVENCGFAPVLCSNEGCLTEINKQDRKHHEARICEFRTLKWHDCAQLRREIEEVKVNVQEQLREIKESRAEMKHHIDEQMEQISKQSEQIIKKIEEQSGQMRCIQEEFKKHVNDEIERNVNDKSEQIRCIQEEMTKHGAVMVEMKHELKQNLEQAVGGSRHLNSKRDIVIAGGKCGRKNLSSAETFKWGILSWQPLNRMMKGRGGESSVVYEGQIIVAGGDTAEFFLPGMVTDSMEITIANQVQWSDFPAKLPSERYQFKSVVYKDRLITTGGYDNAKHEWSDSISQVLLVPPFEGSLLSKMPQARVYHGVELLHNKILILGGRTSFDPEDTLESVLIYNINTNECKQMASLPFAVSEMATASSRDSVYVIGGMDKNGKVLGTVVMYNVNTGESKLLPKVNHPRAGCSAVITENTIVVMGGYDEGGKELCSVECLELETYKWKELPPMKQARRWATAVVMPA